MAGLSCAELWAILSNRAAVKAVGKTEQELAVHFTQGRERNMTSDAGAPDRAKVSKAILDLLEMMHVRGKAEGCHEGLGHVSNSIVTNPPVQP